MVSAITLIILRCRDLAASKRFYEALGLSFVTATRSSSAPPSAIGLNFAESSAYVPGSAVIPTMPVVRRRLDGELVVRANAPTSISTPMLVRPSAPGMPGGVAPVRVAGCPRPRPARGD